MKQILNKLNSSCRYTMIKIQLLVKVSHVFYGRLDILDYIVKVLGKSDFLDDNIENISN